MLDKDIRYQRTKKNILEAMTQLLEKKNFEQITVKNICEQAEISRSGFYLHYTDKYDLVEKYQLELMGRGVEIFSDTLGKGKHELMLNILTFFKAEGKLMGRLISENGSAEIQGKLKQRMKENAKNNILPKLSVAIENDIQERYFISFLSNGFFGILQEWVNSGEKETPEELVANIETLPFYDFLI